MVAGRLAAWGLAVIGAAVLGGCQRKGILDPGAPLPNGDGGVIGAGGPRLGDAGVVSGSGGGSGPDAARADAGSATGGGATDTGGITTAPPTSACARSPGRLFVPPTLTNVPSCSSLSFGSAMSVSPSSLAQSYRRCATLGPETSWRVTLSPDGGHLAAQTSAGTVRLYRTDVWQEVAQLASPVGMIDAIAFSPDGTRLATLSSEMGRLTLWNVADGSLAVVFNAPPIATLGYPASALAFSSDGRRIATSLGTAVDLSTATTTTFDGHAVPPYDVPINPAGRTDLVSTSTSLLRFVGCDQRLLVEEATPAGNAGWIPYLSLVDPVSGAGAGIGGGWGADVGSVVVSPDSRWVAVIRRDEKSGLHLYDAAAATEVAYDPASPRLLAGFSRDGSRLFAVTTTSIDTREVPTLRMLRRTEVPSNTVTTATVSPRDRVIVSNDSASAWIDPDAGAIVRVEAFPIAGAGFSADGRFGVAAGGGATLFHLWDEFDPSLACAPAAAPANAAIAGLAVSRDARTLALADGTGAVSLSAVDLSGNVSPPWTTVATGVAGTGPSPYQSFSVAVANGGVRVAVQGIVPGTSSPPASSRVVVVDTADGTPAMVRDLANVPRALALSPDGAWVALQPDGGALALSVDDDGATSLQVPGGTLESFSPDSRQLAVSWGGTMQVWEPATSTETAVYTIVDSSISHGALSPDWSLMAGVVSSVPYSSDKTATLFWQPQDGTVLRQLGDRRDLLVAPRIDTSNTIVATFAYETHTVGANWQAWHVWTIGGGGDGGGGELRTFPLSASMNEPLAILPGGRRLLTRAGTGVAVWCR